MNGTALCLAIFLCLLLVILMFVFANNDMREMNYRNVRETNDAIKALDSLSDDDTDGMTESFSRDTSITARKPEIKGIMTEQKGSWVANPRVNNKNILGLKFKPVKYNKVLNPIDKDIRYPRYNNFLMRENREDKMKPDSPIGLNALNNVKVPKIDMERENSFPRGTKRITQLPRSIKTNLLKWN